MDVLTQLTLFNEQTHLSLLSPELLLTAVILIAVARLAFCKSETERQDTRIISLVGLLLTFALLMFWWVQYPVVGAQEVLGMFRADQFSLLVRSLLVGGSLLVLLFTGRFINQKIELPGEFYVILLSALLGGMMLSGANDLIMLFVSLETLSIPSYILAGYLRGNTLSLEAGLKYLIYGGMATAVFLFGLSILYGLTGTTSFEQIALSLPAYSSVHGIIWAIMTVMIVGGICFKLSAAPFHMWAPDTYEGAPTPVIAFLSVISKIAAFALAIRLFSVTFGVQPGWAELLSVLAVTSMVVGNVVALTQRNIKRLLAYSTVAHVGYLLLGLVVMTESGLSSVLYYLATYLFMNLGAFAVVTYVEQMTGSTEIADYAGLARKRPGLAFILSIMLLSLAGIPITAGFFGKFFLFQAVANAGPQYLWLVVVALLTSTVSLYYYLNIIRLMVIADPSDAVEALPAQDASARSPLSGMGVAMAICLVGTIGLGVLAQNFMTLSINAIKTLPTQPETARHQAPVVKTISQVR